MGQTPMYHDTTQYCETWPGITSIIQSWCCDNLITVFQQFTQIFCVSVHVSFFGGPHQFASVALPPWSRQCLSELGPHRNSERVFCFKKPEPNALETRSRCSGFQIRLALCYQGLLRAANAVNHSPPHSAMPSLSLNTCDQLITRYSVHVSKEQSRGGVRATSPRGFPLYRSDRPTYTDERSLVPGH